MVYPTFKSLQIVFFIVKFIYLIFSYLNFTEFVNITLIFFKVYNYIFQYKISVFSMDKT